MNRRALLLGGAAVLAGCVSITVELPRIQLQAGRLTAWVVAKFTSWAPSLVDAVKAENAKIQAMTPAGGWGPLARDILTGFVKAVGGLLQAASSIASFAFPALAPFISIAMKVVAALSAFSNLTGAGDVPSLDDADRALAELGV